MTQFYLHVSNIAIPVVKIWIAIFLLVIIQEIINSNTISEYDFSRFIYHIGGVLFIIIMQLITEIITLIKKFRYWFHAKPILILSEDIIEISIPKKYIFKRKKLKRFEFKRIIFWCYLIIKTEDIEKFPDKIRWLIPRLSVDMNQLKDIVNNKFTI